MYLILNQTNRIADITAHASYVRRQKNGVTITCPKEEADAIYSLDSDRFYPLDGIGYNADSYSLTEAAEIPPDVVAGYYYYHNGQFDITTSGKISLLRQKLTDTDYQAIKFSEGVLSEEEYEPVRLRRQAWRDEINELEKAEEEERGGSK